MLHRSLLKLTILFGISISLLSASLLPTQALFDKTRFATDLGVAFFCFHHWVQKPYRDGDFAPGAPHRTKSIIKGGAALLFAINRVKAADRMAHNSKDPLLNRIAGSLDRMQETFGSVGQRLKGGQFEPRDFESLNSTVDVVGAGAAAAVGKPIKDVAVPEFR